MNYYKERLDKLIAAKKAWYQATCEFEIEDELETVECICREKQTHISAGIGLLAEAVGCKITRRKHSDEHDKLSFDYSGVQVFQLIERGGAD